MPLAQAKPFPNKADLEIIVTLQSAIQHGETASGLITMINHGPDHSRNVRGTIVAMLPELRIVSIDPECQLFIERVAWCRLTRMESGESKEYSFEVELAPEATAGSEYELIGLIHGFSHDTNGDNNRSSTMVLVESENDRGTLYVYQDAVPTRPRQVLAGDLSEPVLHLELLAENESIDVTRLVFTNLGTGTENIFLIKLYREGESVAFATASLDQCNSIGSGLPANSFCAVMESQQIMVPEGGGTTVLVRLSMLNDALGAVSGPDGIIQLAILKPSDYADGFSTITARGFDSNDDLLINDGDSIAEGEIIAGRSTPGTDEEIIGHANDTVLAKIFSIQNMNWDADGTNVPVGQNKHIAMFQFTALSNSNILNGINNASIEDIIFTVESSNVAFDSAFDLYNQFDPTQQIRCTPTGAEGAFLVECSATDNTSVDMAMAPWESITLVLEADISSASDGSSLQVCLTDFADRSKSVFGTGNGQSHIRWSDTKGEPSEVLFAWIEYGATEVCSTRYSI